MVTNTEQYFTEQDILKQWVEECCDLVPVIKTASAELYRDFQHWCERSGYDTGDAQRNINQFSTALKERFGLADATLGKSGTKARAGIRLKPAPALEETTATIPNGASAGQPEVVANMVN